jgi:hypothetical protein
VDENGLRSQSKKNHFLGNTSLMSKKIDSTAGVGVEETRIGNGRIRAKGEQLSPFIRQSPIWISEPSGRIAQLRNLSDLLVQRCEITQLCKV